MRVVVATAGTRGDVQPALALALGLRAAGHGILLIAPPENFAWAQRFQIPFQGLGVDYMQTTAQFTRGLDLQTYRRIIPVLRRQLRIQLRQLPRLLMRADAVVGVSLMLGAYSVAEKLEIPCLCVATTPQLLPSRRHPPLEVPCQGLPAWANATAFKLSALTSDLFLRGIINRYRRANRMPPIRSLVSHVLRRPVLVASDPELAPLPDDVTRSAHHLGHFSLPDRDPLPRRVLDFIRAGSPPVYIGFGSMGEDWPRIIPLLREAGRLTGCRLILNQGGAGCETGGVQSDLLVTGPLPHPQLFAHLAAVVHHGGAGTTATAARAGIPQIIVPHLLDQFFWAKRIRDLGLGPKGIPQSRLCSRSLARAITACLRIRQYGNRARQVGIRLRHQNGVARAVKIIESVGKEASRNAAGRSGEKRVPPARAV